MKRTIWGVVFLCIGLMFVLKSISDNEEDRSSSIGKSLVLGLIPGSLLLSFGIRAFRRRRIIIRKTLNMLEDLGYIDDDKLCEEFMMRKSTVRSYILEARSKGKISFEPRKLVPTEPKNNREREYLREILSATSADNYPEIDSLRFAEFKKAVLETTGSRRNIGCALVFIGYVPLTLYIIDIMRNKVIFYVC